MRRQVPRGRRGDGIHRRRGWPHSGTRSGCDQRRQREQTAATSLDEFGTIDILDNNVGIAESAGLLEMTEEAWDRVMKVNVKSAFLTMKAVIPHMIRAEGGAIVNIASIAGIRHLGLPFASYYASKAALLHLSRTTAIELRNRGSG